VPWFRRFLFETSLGRNHSWKRNLEQLRSWQDLGEKGTQKLQDQRLEQLLEHAALHVPYYRDLFDTHGLLAGGRVRIGALTEIPCLDRTTLHREFDRLRSDDLAQRSWKVNSTGGSTGTPVRFIQDYESGIWRAAVEHLFDEWAGTPLGIRRVRLWGSERDLLVGRETLKLRFYRWRRNESSLNAFRMTPAQMRTYAERINKWRPGHILGYADSLYEFSRFVERSGLTVHSPDTIMSSAGTLLPHQRETIERVFRAPVFNRYASREFGGIAADDGTHEGMVVAAPDKCVEVLRPDGSPAGPLEEGEVVITSLTNYAMPLIRYRIGDLACMAERRAARTGWPVLAQVTGRVTDTFVRPDGGVVSSLYFIHLVGVVLSAGWIRKVQVVQEDPSRVIVHLALEPPCTEGSPEFLKWSRELAEKIRAAMGEGCTVEFQVHEDIPADPNGKFRYAIRRVAR
jgi:phenylacetate-CoA ligase